MPRQVEEPRSERRVILSIARIALALLCLLAVLLAFEVGARIHIRWQESRNFEAWAALDTPVATSTGERSTLRDIIRVSRHPEIIYELRPNLDTVYEGARLTTNEVGFRGPFYPEPKPSGTR